jgi:hypothetical protein
VLLIDLRLILLMSSSGVLVRRAAVRHLRQLRHPQTPQHPSLAGQKPESHSAFHADELFVAEHGRNLLRHHHPPSHPSRTFTDVSDLHAAIRTYIDSYNQRAEPRRLQKAAWPLGGSRCGARCWWQTSSRRGGIRYF